MDPIKVARRRVRISGWFLPEHSKKTGMPAFIRIQDQAGTTRWQAELESWTWRQNVVDAMHGADAGNAGFSQRYDLSSLAPGKYKLAVVFSDAGEADICDNKRILDVE